MGKKWKALLAAAAIAVSVSALTGCGSQSAGNHKIVFASHADAVDFTGQIYHGVETQAKALGIEVEFQNAKFDGNLQIDQLNAAIKEKPGAIILLPKDGTGIIQTVEKANEAGIPVIATNRDLNGGRFASVMSDEYQAGQLQGEYMAQHLPQGAKIVYLQGEPGLPVAMSRWQGFKEACLDKRPDIQLLAKVDCNWSEAEGLRYMTLWLNIFPQIDGVIAGNDNMALGAVKAMKAAGRNNGVLVAGCDASEEALKAIAAGDMSITAKQDADATVDAIMKLVQQAMKGETPTDTVKIPYTLVEQKQIPSVGK